MPRLLSQETRRLRGYLKRSVHAVGLVAASSIVGSGNDSGGTWSAQASERRASSGLPIRTSQRGDSGTQARISSVSAAGTKPQAKRPRQPITGARKAPDGTDHDPDGYERSDEPTDKTASRCRNELLNQRQVDAVEPTDPEAHEEAENRQKDPAMVRRERQNTGGELEVENRADEHRTPTNAISQPSPNGRTQDGAYTRRQQNDRRLAEA